MNIYYFADILTVIFEAFMIFIFLETLFEERSIFPKWVYIIGVGVLSGLLLVSNAVFSFNLLNAFAMALSVFIISFMYKGSAALKLIASVTSILFIGVIEIIVMFFITLIFNITAEEAVQIPEYRILGIMVSKLAALAGFTILRVKLKGHEFDIGISYWPLFLCLFANSIVAVFLLFKMSYELKDTPMNNLAIICSFGLLFTTIFALYLYEHLAKQSYVISKNNMLELQLKEQLKHYDNIMMTQGQVKKVRHDLENHLYAIKAYIEKDESVNCLEYIEKLIGGISKSDSYIDTGNTVLDAILTLKKTVAEEKNIEFNTKICIPKDLPLSHEDECIIFGNALDNAIEACDKVKENRYINVYMQYDRDKLICKIINSCANKTAQSKVTTKKDEKNHGIGKDNIMKALEKYKSISKVTCSDNEYELFFIIMDLI